PYYMLDLMRGLLLESPILSIAIIIALYYVLKIKRVIMLTTLTLLSILVVTKWVMYVVNKLK
ncbi:hypothetical protein ACTWQB_17160, partial [Piscibacillus sp. B03]|uniref:hypothetical protein n=1 Tax=Piscibacillus sp. B03 TaxID=3457430 RepID=UPI003FCEDB2A